MNIAVIADISRDRRDRKGQNECTAEGSSTHASQKKARMGPWLWSHNAFWSVFVPNWAGFAPGFEQFSPLCTVRPGFGTSFPKLVEML